MANRVLLVEGRDDEHVIRHLCKCHHVPSDAFEIRQPSTAGERGAHGVDALLDLVPVLLKTSGLERLAIVLDADVDAEARWAAIRHRLGKAGWENLPEHPAPSGTVLDRDDGFARQRIGIWIMPDNRLPGMLEDFLLFLVPPDDRMMSHVDHFLEEIPPQDRLYRACDQAKARIHSYLAVQQEPGKPYGLAITCRFLEPQCEEASRLVAWLSESLLS